MLQPHIMLCDEYLMGVRFENLEKEEIEFTDKKNQRKERRIYICNVEKDDEDEISNIRINNPRCYNCGGNGHIGKYCKNGKSNNDSNNNNNKDSDNNNR